jgi:carbon monoxide dehydrogenase subunit G
MPTIRRTVTVDRPLAEVWAFLSDFTTTEEWDPGTVRTTRRSGDGGVGTVYDNVSKFAGRESELVYTVEAIEPERMIKLKGENPAVTATDTMTFTGTDERTVVEYVAVFDFHGVLKFAAPLMFPLFKKLGDDAAKGMTTALNALNRR